MTQHFAVLGAVAHAFVVQADVVLKGCFIRLILLMRHTHSFILQLAARG